MIDGIEKKNNIKAIAGLFNKFIGMYHFLEKYKGLDANAYFMGSKEK